MSFHIRKSLYLILSFFWIIKIELKKFTFVEKFHIQRSIAIIRLLTFLMTKLKYISHKFDVKIEIEIRN